MSKRLFEMLAYLPPHIAEAIGNFESDAASSVQEVRLRAYGPASLTVADKNLYLCENGLSAYPINALRTSGKELEEAFVRLCNNSVYSHENELKNGFVSLKNGGRAGICGRAIYGATGEFSGFCDITSINIRIPHEIKGAAEPLMPYIFQNGHINGMLLVSPPNMGKTTLLRDIARLASKNGFRVCVVDERNEISATFNGKAENELGYLTDVIVGMDKVQGIEQAVRTMSPQLIICDEIANASEAQKLVYAANSGACVIVSCHAASFEMLLAKGALTPLLESGAVKYITELENLGVIGKVTEVKC